MPSSLFLKIQGKVEKPDDFWVKIKLKVYYLFTQIHY
jgi:hypothetical protein